MIPARDCDVKLVLLELNVATYIRVEYTGSLDSNGRLQRSPYCYIQHGCFCSVLVKARYSSSW